MEKIIINVDQIIEKISTRKDRSKVSLYLSKKVLTDFKKKCGDVSASKVMEELMEAYINRPQMQRYK